MRLGPRKRAALAGAGLATGALVAAAVLGGTAVTVVVAAVVQLAAIAALGQLVSSTARQRRTEARRLAGEVDRLRADLARHRQEAKRHAAVDFAQLEALLALYHEMGHDLEPVRALPATRGWAASPDLLRTCWDLARDQRPTTILECGSGVSTLVLASACRRNGHGRVVTLDHDPEFAAQTRRRLAAHGLDAWAEVRDAPLEPVEVSGHVSDWYRLAEVPPGPFELVLVDGPPGADSGGSRRPAIPLLRDRLADGATVVLDDAARPHEREIVREWVAAHPELRQRRLRHEKGAVVLTVGPRPEPGA